MSGGIKEDTEVISASMPQPSISTPMIYWHVWLAASLRAEQPSGRTKVEKWIEKMAVQGRKWIWDDIPIDIQKPYGETVMSHIVEIAAMMGIYWKEFGRSSTGTTLKATE